MTKPHITHPLDTARRRINDANHHVYRAGYQDTAYELKRAIDKLNHALSIIKQVQADYDFAHPSKIDTSRRPGDPELAPPAEDDPDEYAFTCETCGKPLFLCEC